MKYQINPKNNKVVKKSQEVHEFEIGTLFIAVEQLQKQVDYVRRSMTFTTCFYVMICLLPVLIGLSDLLPHVMTKLSKVSQDEQGNLLMTAKGGVTILMLILTLCVVKIQRIMNKRLNEITRTTKKDMKKMRN